MYNRTPRTTRATTGVRDIHKQVSKISPTNISQTHLDDDHSSRGTFTAQSSRRTSTSPRRGSSVRFAHGVHGDTPRTPKPSRKPSRGSGESKGSATSKASKGRKGRKLDGRVFALSMELMEHAAKGRTALVQRKLGQGAKADYADYDKRTPLHLAACEGHVEVVRILLKYGAVADVRDRWGSRPYDEAVKHGHGDIVEILRRFVGVEEEDTLRKEHHDGLELLEFAARGMVEEVRKKICAGTEAKFADYDRRTALHLAACEGHVEIVGMLLHNGADATFEDRFGHSAVDDAMRNGHLEVLMEMKMRGVKLPGHIFDDSCTVEFQRNMRLIDACARGKIGLVHQLLKGGADPNFGDYDLRTPLHLACAEGRGGVVKLLLGAGGDVSREDRWCVTPFEEAERYGHDHVLKILED